jgi:hypothetical protein
MVRRSLSRFATTPYTRQRGTVTESSRSTKKKALPKIGSTKNHWAGIPAITSSLDTFDLMMNAPHKVQESYAPDLLHRKRCSTQASKHVPLLRTQRHPSPSLPSQRSGDTITEVGLGWSMPCRYHWSVDRWKTDVDQPSQRVGVGRRPLSTHCGCPVPKRWSSCVSTMSAPPPQLQTVHRHCWWWSCDVQRGSRRAETCLRPKR